MVIFASPDWGGAALGNLLLMIASVAILSLAAVGIILGIKLLKRGSSARKTLGVLLLLVSGLFPVFCFVAPPYIVRLECGNYPIGSYPNGKIQEGMSFHEVEAILGSPHQRDQLGGREQWIYWIDSFGIYYFGVDFGPDGHVTHTYGN
jgi:hypothetical protein